MKYHPLVELNSSAREGTQDKLKESVSQVDCSLIVCVPVCGCGFGLSLTVLV